MLVRNMVKIPPTLPQHQKWSQSMIIIIMILRLLLLIQLVVGAAELRVRIRD